MTQKFIKFRAFKRSMRGDRYSRLKGSRLQESLKNKRLDLFFKQLEVDSMRKAVESIEELTFETLKGKSSLQLRLKKV